MLSAEWQYLIIQNEAAARRDAGCRLASLLASPSGDVSASAPQVADLADFMGADQTALKAALLDLRDAGWLADLTWGDDGSLRTRLTLPAGVV